MAIRAPLILLLCSSILPLVVGLMLPQVAKRTTGCPPSGTMVNIRVEGTSYYLDHDISTSAANSNGIFKLTQTPSSYGVFSLVNCGPDLFEISCINAPDDYGAVLLGATQNRVLVGGSSVPATFQGFTSLSDTSDTMSLTRVPTIAPGSTVMLPTPMDPAGDQRSWSSIWFLEGTTLAAAWLQPSNAPNGLNSNVVTVFTTATSTDGTYQYVKLVAPLSKPSKAVNLVIELATGQACTTSYASLNCTSGTLCQSITGNTATGGKGSYCLPNAVQLIPGVESTIQCGSTGQCPGNVPCDMWGDHYGTCPAMSTHWAQGASCTSQSQCTGFQGRCQALYPDGYDYCLTAAA